MYIQRHMEKIIENCKEQFSVLLVTGPRQVGKTTLLKNTCKNYNYITFDDPIILNEAINEPYLFLKNNEIPLFIDEVQYAPSILRYIKMNVDENKVKGSFVLTGSQAFELMKGVSETLAGRMAIVELQGFSLREIFQIPFFTPFIPTDEYMNERKMYLKPYENIWCHIHRGSMPELNDDKIDWEMYYASYVKTYIERDVRQLINITNEIKFMKFLTSLAARCGELLNFTAVSNEVEVDVMTIKRWVSILQASGLIFLLEPYSNDLLKRIVKTPKVYFFDSGLVCYLTRWTNPEVLRLGAKAGNIFENFVISEIMKTHLNSGKTLKSLYFYRDKDKKEIDLIIEENNTLYPVEIKMTANPTKAMAKNFDVLNKISDKNIGNGIILCQYDKKTYLKEDLLALPIEYI